MIVDEAWGAHLPFHPELPTWAMDAGADVCVVSVHKMGAASSRDPRSTYRATWSTRRQGLRRDIDQMPGLHVLERELDAGERLNRQVIDFLLTGLEAGMVLPDPADPSSRRSVSCRLDRGDGEQRPPIG